MLSIELTGRRAVVTGGSRGIGGAIVRTLVEAGARVAFSYQGSSRGQEAAGELIAELGEDRVRPWVARAEDSQETADFICGAAGWLGGIDTLIVNAGYQVAYPLGEIPEDDVRRTLAVNVEGTIYAMQSALPHLTQNARSHVILIGSSAVYSGSAGAHYAASKAALEGLQKAMVKEITAKGVRCNMIHPCLVDTEMLRQRYNTPELRAKAAQTVPLGRMSQPEDIANLTAFLCSDLGEFIVGQSILVDGGRTFGK